MIASALAVCFGYVAGQAICHKFLSHKLPDLLGFAIIVSMITVFQIGANFFSGADEIISLEILLPILAGCGVGQLIVMFLFKR